MKRVTGILLAVFVLLLFPQTVWAVQVPLTLPQDKPAQTVRQGTVLCDTAFYTLPEQDAPRAQDARIGQVVDVYTVGINGKWDAVMIDGKMLYINAEQISVSAPTMGTNDPEMTDGGKNGYPGLLYNDKGYLLLMEEAKKYIGYPYVFGGSTPETSFDCSGFVCWALKHSGTYDIERTDAQSLYEKSEPVVKDDARPGDLIFFQGTYDTPNTVTHVGIYVGNSYMLHAGKPIGYSRMDTPYWQEHFYAFGRLEIQAGE